MMNRTTKILGVTAIIAIAILAGSKLFAQECTVVYPKTEKVNTVYYNTRYGYMGLETTDYYGAKKSYSKDIKGVTTINIKSGDVKSTLFVTEK